MSKQIIRKIILALLIIIGAVLAKFALSFYLNEALINDIAEGNYSDGITKILYALNINEPDIIYYNDGIRYYKMDDFKEAETKFNAALDNAPPESHVCSIRINLSLSILKQTDKSDPNANEKLEKAKEALYEDGCANKEDDNGKSSDAEKLEDEIKKLQEELKKQPDDPGDDPTKDPDAPTTGVDIIDIQKQLQGGLTESLGSRQSELWRYQDFYSGYYGGKIW